MPREDPKGPGEDVDIQEDPTLIPEYIVDQASQRLFVVSLFVLIQCWKIYDILMIKADSYAVSLSPNAGAALEGADVFTSLNNFTFVMKYAFIDGLFLWLLPVLNIPLLTFPPLITLVLTVAVNLLTFVLASKSALPLLSTIFVPMWNTIFKNKELTIVGESVTPQSVIDINSHFKGKYTIHYLPASSVTLNPFNMKNTCIDASTPAVHLPIEFNTTSDIGFMQLQHISTSNTFTLMNFTSHDILKMKSRSSRDYNVKPLDDIFYVDLEIKKPGKYRITKVSDLDDISIRPLNNEFIVSNCPSAKFVYPGIELAYSEYKCVGVGSEVDWTLPLITTDGILPITVEVATSMNGRKIKTFNITIPSDPNATPKGLEWLKAEQITRNSLEQEVLRNPSLLQKTSAGKYEFQVLRVIDNLGISTLYSPVSKDKDINYAVNLRNSAELTLVDRDPGTPLLINSTKRLQIETKQELVLPLTVSIQHEEPTGILTTKSYTFKDAYEFQQGIDVTAPGIYSILNGKDKVCPCTVQGSNKIDIIVPSPPTAVITGKPIADKCVGTIGFEFDIDFTGSAPYQILYEVFKNSSGVLRPVLNERGLRDHSRKTTKRNYSFEYKPLQEGSYVLVFKNVKDVNYYKQPVAIDQASNTFLTYFHKRSKYSFFKSLHETSKQLNVCKGGKVELPVYFEGNLPFSFTYEIIDGKGKVFYSLPVKDYVQDSYVLKSPSFDEGGDFLVVLKDVVDKLGCPVDSVHRELIKIKARREIPEILLAEKTKYEIVEGDTVQIPLKVKSSVISQNDKIVYTVQPPYDSTKIKQLAVRGSEYLHAKEEGIYKLVSYESNGCPGIVSSKDLTVTVSHYPKPNLTITANEQDVLEPRGESIQLKSICQNSPRTVKLKLEGKKPFIVNYSIRYPSGSVKSSFISIDNDEIVVPLPTQQEGTYEHSFTAVFDNLYTKEKMARLPNKQQYPILKYDVQGSPNLKVEKLFIQLCETRLSADKGLEVNVPVVLEGRAPFQIKGSIRHVNSDNVEKFHLTDVRGPNIKFDAIKPEGAQLSDVLTVGDHVIVFEEITDANHCQQKQLSTHNTLLVSITKVPSISKQTNKPYYCVGDHVAYLMSGILPFVVYYKFNEQVRKAELGHTFHRLASKPGELAILALQDSSLSQCMVNFTNNNDDYNELKIQVYDLPSVEISHGDNIIKNLHEGDKTQVTFKFTGVPPFLLTFVRTLGDEEGRHKRRNQKVPKTPKVVVETKTVNDIWDYEYTEVVSLEGTYEAIRVEDAYCSASRDVNDIL